MHPGMASNGVNESADDAALEQMETDMTPEPNEDVTASPLLPSPRRGSEGEEQEEEERGEEERGKDASPRHETEFAAPTPGMVEAEEEEGVVDCCRPEGIVEFVVEGIHQLSVSALSKPVYIRNLPWRLLVMPRDVSSQEGKIKGLGVFVQCNPESPESLSWNVSATATISLLSHISAKSTYSREIYHCFCARENDWGYSNFLAWKDLIEPAKGFVMDGAIVIRAHIVADAPHGINWDSRKHTGYVGLKNQGATCYMNSLLQTLFCTNKLRKAVYQMPTDTDDANKSVPLALQRLFYELQNSDKPVGTKKLTKSFGWDTIDIFMQHDVQELSRVLLDNIERKMKGTVVEDTIPKLFEGKTESFIRCTHVDYESTRVETFFDLQLNIKGKKNVYESFKDYVAVETLDGDNKYDAGDHGMQEAKKGVIFLSLPPVLHLQLMRFQYDPATDTNVKINDRYEFPEHLTLEEFLKQREPTPAAYTLHAVLVHSGDNYGGHYVAYLNPRGRGTNWLKFDDDVVSTCSRKDAVDHNYGGSDDTVGIRSCTNAYMLVYIRDSCIDDVLSEVTDVDVSDSLMKRLAEEKRLESLRRKERSEAHLYFTVEAYLEDDFESHVGPDLLDFEEVKPRSFKVLKSHMCSQFHRDLAKALGYPSNQIRVWPFEKRNNKTIRPSYLDKLDDPSESVFSAADQKQVWKVYVETLPPDSCMTALPKYDYQTQVLLFFKYYDPISRTITYIGHSVEPLATEFRDLFSFLRKRACLSPDTPLLLFEEVKPNLVECVDTSANIMALDEVRDGDILCYQRADIIFTKGTGPTVMDYFRDLYNRIDILFYDRNVPGDPGFTITLNQRMRYSDMATTVAQHLNTDPLLLQFFKQMMGHRHISDQPIRCTNEGYVRDFINLQRHRSEGPVAIPYQRLTIPINEFENKKVFRCVYISPKLKEEKELTLYVDKNGTVEDLLCEAEKEITLGEDSSRCLRLLEVMTHRIIDVHHPDKLVNELFSQKMYRVEEVGRDEIRLTDDEALIPVAHFQKAPHNVFGIPFLLKITDGDSLVGIASRVQELLDVPDRDFDKWKFAIIQSVQPPQYLSEEKNDTLHLSQFLSNPSKGFNFPRLGSPWLGLDHINKNPKRTRYTLEKAIKIHN